MIKSIGGGSKDPEKKGFEVYSLRQELVTYPSLEIPPKWGGQ